MKNGVVPVDVRAIIPGKSGSAIFLGNDEKVFVIHVDTSIAHVIALYKQGMPRPRPLTHDLIGHIFAALDVKLERVVVNDLRAGTYFARLILRVDNEIHHKIVEIDARPSDCIALAAQTGAPLLVNRRVWDEVEDASEALRQAEEESDDE
jgi:hypothetical protein